jgi:modulator of FtsH protease HflK
MPWNDQSSGPGGDKGAGKGSGQGPWGSGQRPWGQPPKPPGQSGQGPDLEEIWRRFLERIRGSGEGGGDGGARGAGPRGSRGLGWPTVAAILVFGWIASGLYIVNEGERGVITRFGAYDRTDSPGMHWHLPWPIERRDVVNVEAQRTLEVGVRGDRDVADESLMITGDRNIVDIDFRVYYRISSAFDYLFKARDVDDPNGNGGAVRAVAESAMREVIGQRQLEAIITRERAQVEQATEELMQKTLNSYGAGVEIIQVQLLKASAPPDVIDAFDDVVRAGQDAETQINGATRYVNERVPQARGEAAQIVQEAEAYKAQVVREASGEADRFRSVQAEYQRAPRVTRDRIYLETMERIFHDANTIIVDQHGGAVTYLPLDQMMRRNPAATPQTPAPQPQPQQQGGRP